MLNSLLYRSISLPNIGQESNHERDRFNYRLHEERKKYKILMRIMRNSVSIKVYHPLEVYIYMHIYLNIPSQYTINIPKTNQLGSKYESSK